MADERGSWGSWLEFLLSFLGSAVGFGNVWRFPYLCFRSGGGAFLIPFAIVTIFCGIPCVYLEAIISQYSAMGPGRLWVVCPLFQGVGLSVILLLTLNSVYYTMLMGWTLYYFGMSFSCTLPWTTCDNDWNTPQCFQEMKTLDSPVDFNGTVNTSQRLVLPYSSSLPAFVTNVLKSAVNNSSQNVTAVSSAEEYWFNAVLGKSSSIEELGTIRWPLLLCLLAAWVSIYLCLIKGIKSMGKVVYVTATLPYVILTCLLVRGCMLPGSGSGIYYLLVPEWDRWLDPMVWRNAASQAFFSLGIGVGLLSTLASHNKFHNNLLRDCILVPVLDCITSLFAGLVIFAYVGYMAEISGHAIEDVVDQGVGLVFIAYPTAVGSLPLPQLWAVLFFLLLFCLGLDSMTVQITTITTAVTDCRPHLLPRRNIITIAVCTFSFLLGISLTTQGGIYILTLADWYFPSFVFLIVALELVGFAWVYGTDRIYEDVAMMNGRRPCFFWKYTWKYVAPAFAFMSWIYGMVDFKVLSSKFQGFPHWADSVGFAIAIIPALIVPAVSAIILYNIEGLFMERLRTSLKPSRDWKPAIQKSKDNGESVPLNF